MAIKAYTRCFRFLSLSLFCLFLFTGILNAEAKHVLKLATVAPKGSIWAVVMEEMNDKDQGQTR